VATIGRLALFSMKTVKHSCKSQRIPGKSEKLQEGCPKFCLMDSLKNRKEYEYE